MNDVTRPEPSAAPRARVRITSVVATLASLTVAVAFFLPWIAVPVEDAERFREGIMDRLDDPSQPSPVAVDDWRRLADLVVAQRGRVSGLDVFYWARTARVTADALERDALERDALEVDAREVDAPGDPPETDGEPIAEVAPPRSTAVSRAILVATVALGALPAVAILVAIALLFGRWRHAASPVLVLALLTGAVAVAVPAVYSIVAPALGFPTEAETGLVLLLPAGGALVLAGVFGMRRRNWWRVAIGALLFGGLLVMLAWGYVASGA